MTKQISLRQNANVKKFLKELKETCKENRVGLKLIPKKAIRIEGNELAGCFGGARPEIWCATRRKDWLQILVHESCHMDQFLYDKKMWKKGDSCDQLYYWLRGKNYRNINTHINNVQDLETDCEKRSVEKIKKYGLPIDTTEYVKKANAYIYFYTYIKTFRKWTDHERSPYTLEGIWKKMPSKFLKSYRKLPQEYKRLFDTYLKD